MASGVRPDLELAVEREGGPVLEKMQRSLRAEHGIHKLAFEMHPGFVVYNPMTLM